MNHGNICGRFRSISLEPGVAYRYLPHDKWKTLSINVFCKVPMKAETVTPVALVPRLNKRGTVSLPTLRDLSRDLESMYGAGLGADTSKIGSVQVVRFGITLPAPEFAGTGSRGSAPVSAILEKAMSLVWDLAAKPYLDKSAYPRDRFETEREEHRRDILGIINSRPRYAAVRLAEEISRGDPSGLPSWGTLEGLKTCNPEDTWNVWATSLSQSPISIYAVGKGVELLVDGFQGARLGFPLARDPRSWDGQSKPALLPPEQTIEVEEYLPGEQAILCMAFHTGISGNHPLLPALIFFDGVLGGFPHSKLFMNVREKERLAYFADSSLNVWRGMVMTTAGIMDCDRKKTRDLIAEQVEAIKKGEVSDAEFENTKTALLRRYRSESDSQGALVRRFLTQEIIGGPATEEELVERIAKVKKDDIVSVANRARLVAIYTLRSQEDGRR